MIRLLNMTLALLAFCGAIVAFRESSLNRDLLEQHRSLAAETGYLDVSDSSKVHVVALASEDPLHFRWRIYLPDKCTVIWKTNQWGEFSHSISGPQDFIAQVRLRNDESGFIRVFEDLEAYGSLASVGGREFQNFMSDRWNEIEILQLGADGPVAIEPHVVSTLLRLQLPKNIAAEAESVLPVSWSRQVVPVLYQLQFGSKEAWLSIESGESVSGDANR